MHLMIFARLPLVTPSSSSGTGSCRVPRHTPTWGWSVSIYSNNCVFICCNIFSGQLFWDLFFLFIPSWYLN